MCFSFKKSPCPVISFLKESLCPVIFSSTKVFTHSLFLPKKVPALSFFLPKKSLPHHFLVEKSLRPIISLMKKSLPTNLSGEVSALSFDQLKCPPPYLIAGRSLYLIILHHEGIFVRKIKNILIHSLRKLLLNYLLIN